MMRPPPDNSPLSTERRFVLSDETSPTLAQASFLPAEPGELEALLDAYLLEKAIYEMAYELNNGPGWTRIPLQGILQTLERARGEVWN